MCSVRVEERCVLCVSRRDVFCACRGEMCSVRVEERCVLCVSRRDVFCACRGEMCSVRVEERCAARNERTLPAVASDDGSDVE